MEPILIIGAAAVVLVAIILACARRRHKISLCSSSPAPLPISPNLQILEGHDTSPAAVEHQSRKGDESSFCETPPLGQEEPIEPSPHEFSTPLIGRDEACRIKTAGVQEGEAETVQSSEPSERPESTIADETHRVEEGQNEGARDTTETQNVLTGTELNLVEEEAHVSNLIGEDLPDAMGSAGDEFAQIGVTAPTVAADAEDMKAVDGPTGPTAIPDAVALVDPTDRSTETKN